MHGGLTAVSLPLDIRNSALARRSDKVEPWQVHFDREITHEDLLLLHSVTRGAPDPKAPLAKVKDAHHALARMVAEGAKNAEISSVYGYSLARISTLRTDPAFMELVEFYSEQQVFRDADIDAQIRHVGLAASQVLMERLEDEPETFSNKELRELRDASLDRIGKGPTRKLDISTNDPSKVIEMLKDALAAEGITRVIPKGEIEAHYEEVEEAVDQTTPSPGA